MHQLDIVRPDLCRSASCFLANRFLHLKMNAIKHSAKCASLFSGQDDQPKNPPLDTFREVQISGARTANACTYVYHIDQRLVSELLSCISKQNLSAPADGDTFVLVQTSAEMVLVLSAVSRRWILMCYDTQPLPADKLFGPSHDRSLYHPGKLAP